MNEPIGPTPEELELILEEGRLSSSASIAKVESQKVGFLADVDDSASQEGWPVGAILQRSTTGDWEQTDGLNDIAKQHPSFPIVQGAYGDAVSERECLNAFSSIPFVGNTIYMESTNSTKVWMVVKMCSKYMIMNLSEV